MDDTNKLRHLLEHWSEHNAEHAITYNEWSKKAEALGKSELADILKQIADETIKLEGLFKKAGSLCT